MVLSKFNRPEEKIRQKWLRVMKGPLGYPKGLLAVEKTFSKTGRRFDILCYVLQGGDLSPLLLIECKALGEKESALSQVVGYNEEILAPFICVIQGDEAQTFWKEHGALVSVPFLPSYSQLLKNYESSFAGQRNP